MVIASPPAVQLSWPRRYSSLRRRLRRRAV